jgi:hypothetical protein
MKRFLFAVLVVAPFLAGCEPIDTAPLPSANFSVPASKDRTKEALVALMTGRGYTISTDSTFLLAFDKPEDSLGAAILYGSDYDATPNLRVVYTVTGSSPAQVVTRMLVVTNPGSAFERTSDVTENPKLRAQLADFIEQLQNAV